MVQLGDIAQTDKIDGTKYIFSEKPLTAKQIDEWELSPLYTTEEFVAKSETKIPTKVAKAEPKVETKMLKKDTVGNTLTESQIEYFKDSKVIDKDGNLLVAHHGTYDDFGEFDIKKAGQRDAGDFGEGFYFTSDKNWANAYSGDTQKNNVYVFRC